MTLDLIRDFVNTADLLDEKDALATPVDTAAWLVQRGLVEPGTRVGAADHGRALDLREAIRGLLLRNNGVDAQARPELLEDAARRARLELAFRPDGPASLEPRAGGVAGALGRIVAACAASQAEGTWSRLKACRADDCRWAFLDGARNRSRAWCSMSSCGNRAKARVYRERHGRGRR